MEGNLLTNTAAFAMAVTLQYVREGDFVIDGTCGNGHDTLALAEAVGNEGRVLAVDIQKQAVEAAGKRLEAAGFLNTVFYTGNFSNLRDYAENVFGKRAPRAIVFNLGYLPGGDKAVTTQTEDTLKAFEAALKLVEPGGIVTFVLYPGHQEGKEEQQAVLSRAECLAPDKYHTVYASLPNQKKNPPEILWITRKK